VWVKVYYIRLKNYLQVNNHYAVVLLQKSDVQDTPRINKDISIL
jgi:hypothetical protein